MSQARVGCTCLLALSLALCAALPVSAGSSSCVGGPDCNGNGISDECDVRQFYVEQPIAGGGRIFDTGDIDGDGDPDLLLAEAWQENLDGLGSFGPPQATFVPEPESRTLSVSLVDLDADGDLDILRRSRLSNPEPFGWVSKKILSWYENADGQGQYGPEVLLSVGWAYEYDTVVLHRPGVADLDADGDNDLVVCFSEDDWDGYDHSFRVLLFENDSGQFSGSDIYNASTGSGHLSTDNSCFIADIDGDGAPDVGLYDRVFSLLGWLPNDGNGNFGAPVQVDDPYGDYTLHAVDLDGDNDVDLLRHQCEFINDPDEVIFYENDGQGGFSDPTLLVMPPNCAFEAWDLDADGDTDLILDDTLLSWHESKPEGLAERMPLLVAGTGGFFESQSPPVDLDGDGLLDLTGVSSWLRNESGGSLDCDNNGVPDECENDCNANGWGDACDIRDGISIDCNGNGEPDECETGCTETCDADGDLCVDMLDSSPFDPNSCGDVDEDGCDDCSNGSFDPTNDGPNSDLDLICDVGDCAPMDNGAWFPPGAARELRGSKDGTTVIWTWEAPSETGAVSVQYDTFRSYSSSDFTDPTQTGCIDFNDDDRVSTDFPVPPVGAVWHYLVRVENGCLGEGEMGSGSDGVPRSGVPCG